MEDRLDYRSAGVDIDAAEQALKGAKNRIQATHTARVLGRFGAFSGLFDLKDLGRDPILVASCDGVGTKLRLAFQSGMHNTIGQDLVNHCVNDIVCCGAKPLFFLDYLGIERLTGKVFEGIVEGLSLACQENGLALLGGETAELPGMYMPGEYDLAGTIIGCVERDRIVDGSRIEAGDAIIGLESTGLHTNGYSLAQKALFDKAKLDPKFIPPGLTRPLIEELMTVHRSYSPLVLGLLDRFDIRGLAHITGGGFGGNIPRVLPDGIQVEIDAKSWSIPPIFSIIQDAGNVAREEMYRVFNMGIGLVVICPESAVDSIISYCQNQNCGARRIGICHADAARAKFNLVL